MKFVLEIRCDGPNFVDESGDEEPRANEIATILEDVAKRLRNNPLTESVSLASNGAVVGLAAFTEGE